MSSIRARQGAILAACGLFKKKNYYRYSNKEEGEENRQHVVSHE
jgi:hypothetical protein